MMPHLLENAGPSAVVRLGWTLIHFLWQGAAVAVLFAAVNAGLRRASAEARYTAGCIALLLMLALPVTTFVTRSAKDRPAAAMTRAAANPAMNLAREVAQATAAIPARPRLAERLERGPRNDAGSRPLAGALPGLVTLWSVGVALLSLRVLAGWNATRRLGREGVTLAADPWQAALARLAERLEVGAVRLYESVRVEVPSVIGWLKPVILVPSSMLTGLTPAQVEAVLAHELAHVRRHDFLANLLQTVIETLLFYHPAVWWVSHRVRIEREHCCDDLAIAVCGDPIGYARALTELEAGRAPSPRLALAATGGSLLHRIARLVRGVPRRHADPPAWLGPVVALVTLAGLAAVTEAPRSEPARAMRRVIATARAVVAESPAPVRHALLAVRAATRAEDAACATISSVGGDLSRIAGFADLTARTLTADARALPVVAGANTACDGSASPALAKSCDGDDDPEAGDASAATLGEDELIELAQAGLTPRAVRAFTALGFTGTSDLIALTQNGVSPAYVRALRALGYTLEAEDLILLVQNGVAAADVAALHEMGYDDVSTEDLVKLRAHAVSPRFIAGMKWLGYDNLPLDQQIAMRDQGVLVEDVARFRVLGYRDLDPQSFIQLRQQGVSPEYAGLMRKYHQEVPPVETLIRLRQQGVEPQFALGIRALGYDHLDFEELIQLRQQGVTLEWLAGIREAGYDDLSAGELVSLRQQDVSGTFIHECFAAGYRKLSVNGLIRLRQLGVVPVTPPASGEEK